MITVKGFWKQLDGNIANWAQYEQQEFAVLIFFIFVNLNKLWPLTVNYRYGGKIDKDMAKIVASLPLKKENPICH